MDVRDVPAERHAVLDVLAFEPAIKSRFAAWKVKLDEMRRNPAGLLQRQDRSRGSGRSNHNRFLARKAMKSIQVVDLRIFPRLGMHRENHLVLLNVPIRERRRRGRLEY